MKADWFELDCTLTRDGKVIVIHDDTLERTTGFAGAVSDATLAEIKKLDAGSWFSQEFAGERLPTLGEALDFAKGKLGVYIEIKNSDDDSELMEELLRWGVQLLPDRKVETMNRIEASRSRNVVLTRKVIEEVRSRGMQRQIVIQSFSPIVCAVALMDAPEIRTELLASSSEDRPDQWTDYLTWARLLRPAGFNPNKDDLTQGLIEEMHGAGLTIATWTVNETDDMDRLAKWGVDAIITNHPDVCLEVLGRTANPR
jgi:glycerophosphoryl diester phosphodiesterase